MKATILATTLLLGFAVAGTSQSAQAGPLTIADFAATVQTELSVNGSGADAGHSALLHTVKGFKGGHRGGHRGSFRGHRRGGLYGHRSFGHRGFNNRRFRNRSFNRGFGHQRLGHGLHGQRGFGHGDHHRGKTQFGLFGLFFK